MYLCPICHVQNNHFHRSFLCVFKRLLWRVSSQCQVSQKSCQIWYSAYSRTLGRDFLDLKYSDWNILFFNISTWDWHTELTKDTDIMQHKNRIFCEFFCNLYRKISILSKIWWCFSLWNFPGKESHLAAIKNNMYLV